MSHLSKSISSSSDSFFGYLPFTRRLELPADILKLAIDIIDLNSAVFDAKNNFSGCIPGINYILFKSGLMKNIRCVNPSLKLSPGQKEEIDRVYQRYSYLNDQDFVKENIDKWTEEL